jgi:uncharacterized protein (TIGR02145 family)
MVFCLTSFNTFNNFNIVYLFNFFINSNLMKRILIIIITSFCVLTANAQNYLISFAGSGASTNVSTVKIENLTAGTTLTLNGSDILSLTITTGINSIGDKQSPELKIYPNPMTDNSSMEVYPPVAGDAIITVYEMTGKPVSQIQSYLDNGRQEFNLSGFKNGVYLISVKGDGYQLSGKLLCNGESNGTARIEKLRNTVQTADEKTVKTGSKGTQATVDMAYSTGDRLKFTGISGNYSTVKTDIPAGDKTITFNFIACTDGDNNNYPIVEIGSQVWMAENLKTTRYRNGDLIGTTTPATMHIYGEDSPKYQWAYEGNEAYVAAYGRLYTWWVVSDNRNLCPSGWHVPTDSEWSALTDYLSNNGYGYEGDISKISRTLAATSGWLACGEPGTTGFSLLSNNSTGFTALPAGARGDNLSDPDHKPGFVGGGVSNRYTDWWTVTEYDDKNFAWYREIVFSSNHVGRGYFKKVIGLSVRCLKDN